MASRCGGSSCAVNSWLIAAVGDAHHPDLVVLHPGLIRDRLDHVVPVEALQRLEEVERATRAAGPAHVHVDDREAHQVRQDRDAVVRTSRVGVPVTRVFDQRRVRRSEIGAARKRRARWQPGLAGRTRRRVHVDGELRAVAGGQVPVAAVGDRLVVDVRIPRRRVLGVHRERAGFAPSETRDLVARRPAPRRGTASRRASRRSVSARRPRDRRATLRRRASPVTYTWRALPAAWNVGVAAEACVVATRPTTNAAADNSAHTRTHRAIVGRDDIRPCLSRTSRPTPHLFWTVRRGQPTRLNRWPCTPR